LTIQDKTVLETPAESRWIGRHCCPETYMLVFMFYWDH